MELDKKVIDLARAIDNEEEQKKQQGWFIQEIKNVEKN